MSPSSGNHALRTAEDPKEQTSMSSTTTTAPTTTTDGGDALWSVPVVVNAGLDRVHMEQARAGQLLAGAAKFRRLSALYEHEARLWTLLVQHTAASIYGRAAMEAQCSARARAREYADLARSLADLTTTTAGGGL